MKKFAHRHRFNKSSFLAIFFVFYGAVPLLQANTITQAHTRVTLIPQVETIQPGRSFQVAVVMNMEEGWHTYWKNPGDSGLAPTIHWTLPEGFNAGPVQWPYPRRIDAPPLTTYGYEGKILLLTRMDVPSSVVIGSLVSFQAKVSWLTCKIECIPGSAEFKFSLPVRAAPSIGNETFKEEYNNFRDFFPASEIDWKITVKEDKGSFRFFFKYPSKETSLPEQIQFFSDRGDIIDHAAQQTLRKVFEGYELAVIKSSVFSSQGGLEKISGVLVFEGEAKGQRWKKALETVFRVEQVQIFQSSFKPKEWGHFGRALIFAFLGGLILNLMPCVLPVLSIKVLGLLEQAKQSRFKAWQHSLLFSLGILVAFWFLAGFIVVLKTAGKNVGWGFQFQSPLFIIFMAVLFFWLGLNLLGVFEVGTALTRIENTLRTPMILKSPFFNGVLATIVATPCTAPFMGSALGYSLSMPGGYAFLIFTFLGLGLAAPYLTLTAFPQLLKFVPRPGAWMLVLKKIFGFMFFAVVIWLASVLGAQRGAAAVSGLYFGLLLVGIGAWIIGQWATVNNPGRARWVARAMGILLFLLGGGLAVKGVGIEGDISDQLGKGQDSGILWQRFSPELIEDLRSQHRPIFLDFTAQWCLSCQVNERLAIHHRKVIEKMNALGIVPVKADWTNYDESIKQALAGFGKTSIPVYVLYSPDINEKPVILPEILTPGILLEAFEDLYPNATGLRN